MLHDLIPTCILCFHMIKIICHDLFYLLSTLLQAVHRSVSVVVSGVDVCVHAPHTLHIADDCVAARHAAARVGVAHYPPRTRAAASRAPHDCTLVTCHRHWYRRRRCRCESVSASILFVWFHDTRSVSDARSKRLVRRHCDDNVVQNSTAIICVHIVDVIAAVVLYSIIT